MPDELMHIVCDTRRDLKSLLMRRLMQAYRAPLSVFIRSFAISTVSALS